MSGCSSKKSLSDCHSFLEHTNGTLLGTLVFQHIHSHCCCRSITAISKHKLLGCQSFLIHRNGTVLGCLVFQHISNIVVWQRQGDLQAHHDKGDYDGAMVGYQAAVEIQEAVLENQPPQLQQYWKNSVVGWQGRL
jgi:hypothetical protein